MLDICLLQHRFDLEKIFENQELMIQAADPVWSILLEMCCSQVDNIDNCRYVCYHGWIWWWRCPCPIYIICMPISLRTTVMMSPSYGSLRSQYSCAYFQSYDFLQIPFWSIIDLNSRLTTMAVVRLDRMITFVITK